MVQRILIADDDGDIRDYLGLLLRSHGFSVDEATDGFSALAMINRQQYAAVLLDLMMPGCSGLDVLAGISPRCLDATPVVVISATADKAQIRRCYGLGAAFFLQKPFGGDQLVAIVRYFIDGYPPGGQNYDRCDEIATFGR